MTAVDGAGEKQVIKKGDKVAYNGAPAEIAGINPKSGYVEIISESAERGRSSAHIAPSALGKGTLTDGYEEALQHETALAVGNVERTGRSATVGGKAFVKAGDGTVVELEKDGVVNFIPPGAKQSIQGTVEDIQSVGVQGVGKKAAAELVKGRARPTTTIKIGV